MGLLDVFRRDDHHDVAELREQLYQSDNNNELLTERLAELELALEDEGWLRIALAGEREFTDAGLRKIRALARLMYLKNPLIQRAVNVQAFYVWAQGVQIHAVDDVVNDVIQRFHDDPGNRRVFTGHQARMANDVALANEGERFLPLFVNAVTGHVRIRSIVPDEIVDVICNPEDSSEPWFYRREWNHVWTGLDGNKQSAAMKALYPDWRYRPRLRLPTVAGLPVYWDTPTMHVRSGGIDGMRRGVPETYASLDWARAYKSFLEDWASLVRSLSRFAWKVTTKNAKVATTRARLNSTLSTTDIESNPPPTTGAAFVGDEGINIDAIPKTGATTSADDGKGLRLMVAASMNIPDTILSGDVDQGNLATSKTLDRPTELAFRSRQTMWTEVLDDLHMFVIQASIRATSGRLSGTITVDADGFEEIVLTGNVDPTVQVKFPPILEHDITETIGAIVRAATLDGKAPAGTLPDRVVSEMLLVALGADDVDDLLELLDTQPDEAQAAGVTEAFVEVLREVRDAIPA